MPEISIKSLLEAGVHFGHQTRRWNPKMAPWLFGDRDGVHIIDLEQALGYLHEAQAKVREVTKAGGLILFVGTKRQGKDTIKKAAEAAGMPYVTERWLGGLLTNFETIRERLKLLLRLTDEKASGDWERLPKKEQARKQDDLQRLETLLGGVKDLGDPPAAVYINDVVREDLAVKEAKKLGLPIIGVVDSNADPDLIDYPIPGNDDAVRAVAILAEAISEAAKEGREHYLKQAKAAEVEAVKAAEAKQAAKPKESVGSTDKEPVAAEGGAA